MSETISVVPDSHVRNGRKGGRPPGKHWKSRQAIRESNVSYFCKVLDDETERELWLAFIMGTIQKRDVKGEKVFYENGQPEMITLKEAGIEVTPISWSAFKRAVEYKRGMPSISVQNDNGESSKFELVIRQQGANPQFFEQQARLLDVAKAASSKK